MRGLRERMARAFAKVERAPIIFIGNQKSGTTAIPALLSEATGIEANLNVQPLWEPGQSQVYARERSFKQLVDSNKHLFSTKIIKEPCMTFLYDQVRQEFPEAIVYLIIRDPRENIRSILNRLNIPGDLEAITNKHLEGANPTWKSVVDNRWLGIDEEHYIDSMAERWNKAASIHVDHKEHVRLLKYEDFNQGKKAFIHGLADELGMPVKHDISHRVDHPFQRKGDHSMKGEAFFGPENYERIRSRCEAAMDQIGYTW